MNSILSLDRIRFLLSRLGDRLWVKPLVVCLISVSAVFAAKLAQDMGVQQYVPKVGAESLETLLQIMASSMLVIATFSVSSMVSAYSAASSTATPRSFSLVVSDDASQNALSTFVGAFIFSIVALTATLNDYFEVAGLFVLFVITVFVFAIVILTFIHWVDRIARLGRIGSTIDKVEIATVSAFKRRLAQPTLGGIGVKGVKKGQAIYSDQTGYVQHIDIAALQACAKEADVTVLLNVLPGTFATPRRALAYVNTNANDTAELNIKALIRTFQIGGERLFEEDPRFGLVVLSEIAGRALSPAVNDPGTAIDVIGTLLRLLLMWEETDDIQEVDPKCDRVAVPEICVNDMFEDAFTAIARDGAGVVEVGVRLQKALYCLAGAKNANIRSAAEAHAGLALKRAKKALALDEDYEMVKNAGKQQ